MDIKSKEDRKRNMAAIHSKNTKPEVFLRKLLFHHGYRYRIHQKSVPGTPDLFLKKYNTAIFVNGCFWHRHKNCKLAYTPKSNQEFWQKKFQTNIERDIRQQKERDQQQIRTIVVWECTVRSMMKSEKVQEEVIRKISDFLHDKTISYAEF